MSVESASPMPQSRTVPADGRIRVLWVAKGLGPGGAERLLVAAASAHDRDRFSIDCAYVLPWKQHLVPDLEQSGVRTVCVGDGRAGRALWPARLAQLVRTGGYDVVHVHSPLPGAVARVAARTVAASRRPLTMSTEHNTWGSHARATRIANTVTAPLDAASYAVTSETLESMRGPARARAQVLVHGIDTESVAAARSQRAAIRAELGLAEDTFVIATAANFRPQKDYPNLLGAARILADRGADVRFVAVGQGPGEAETRALANEMGLDETVTLTGFRADAVAVVGAADCFVLASAWEGLPVALMEAFALGLPVVATAVGGVAETVVDGTDGLLVPARDAQALADALERVATDPDLRESLAAGSAARAGEFDASRAQSTLEATYLHLCGRPAAVPNGSAT